MSSDYTLPEFPPLPKPTAWAGEYPDGTQRWKFGTDNMHEFARAYGHACAEHVRGPPLARIAELEQSVKTFRAARDGYRNNAFRLSADKRALLQGNQEQASEIDRLRADVEKLRAALSQCATAVGASAATDCSVEFLSCVPREVELVVEKLRADAEWKLTADYPITEAEHIEAEAKRARKAAKRAAQAKEGAE